MARLFYLLAMIAFSVTHGNAATYNYMDDSNMCSGSTVQLWSDTGTSYLSAWDPTSITHTPLTGGCTMTISSYGLYGTKYKFNSGGYINSRDVTLNVYEGTTIYGTKLGTYSSGSSLPTHYIDTHNGYITVELENPSNSEDFDFTIKVKSLDDIHDDYASIFTHATTIGAIIGGVSLVIGLTSLVLYLRIRRRRRILTNVEIAPETVTNVKTSGHQDHYSGQYWCHQ